MALVSEAAASRLNLGFSRFTHSTDGWSMRFQTFFRVPFTLLGAWFSCLPAMDFPKQYVTACVLSVQKPAGTKQLAAEATCIEKNHRYAPLQVRIPKALPCFPSCNHPSFIRWTPQTQSVDCQAARLRTFCLTTEGFMPVIVQ